MDKLDSLIREYEKLFSRDVKTMDPQAFINQQKRLEELGKKISGLKQRDTAENNFYK
jgi:hypothetical protein